MTSSGQSVSALENGLSDVSVSFGWGFGRFNEASDGSVLSSLNHDGLPSGTQTQFKLTLANLFSIKRATDVTASATPVTGGRLKVKIHADRNASFQNTTAPTYRRETVLPDTPADRAAITRNGKVIKRVKLSIYGNATTTIPDSGRGAKYAVVMAQTNDHSAGSAAFTGYHAPVLTGDRPGGERPAARRTARS